MEIKIIMPERLLNHQKIEGVKLFQMLNLVQRVSGVGIATQHNFRPARADLGENFQIPARFAFDLNATIACIEFSLNFFQQLLV
jgi:hypothetical protein